MYYMQTNIRTYTSRLNRGFGKTLKFLDHHNIEVQIENLVTMLLNISDQAEAKVPSFFCYNKEKYLRRPLKQLIQFMETILDSNLKNPKGL